jgi:RNA polymerase sigma-70 factor (ECF subfamily)
MDSIYIQKVLNGDKHAFRYFIDQYRDMSYSIALSIVKSKELAEEVTQEAFIKAYKALPKFEQRSKFSTWLYKIVTNEALKIVKKKRFDAPTDIDDISYSEETDINTSVTELSEQDQKKYINMVLDRMLPNDSLILRLYYLNENNLKEIVEITDFSENKIKTILHRARKRFYALLKDILQHELKSIL